MKHRYNVGFIDNGIVRKVLKITAFSQLEAYKTAEEIYKSLGWHFEYNDMFCDLLTF